MPTNWHATAEHQQDKHDTKPSTMFQLKDEFQSGSLRGVLCNTENLHGGLDDSTFLAYTLISQVASSTHPFLQNWCFDSIRREARQ